MWVGKAAAVLAVAVLATSSTLAADDERETQLSLSAAVAHALSQNDRVLAAGDAVTSARLGLTTARSAFNLKVQPTTSGWLGQSALANQRYELTASRLFTTGTRLTATNGAISSRNQFGTFFNAESTFLVSQPLLRGFGRTPGKLEVTTAEARIAEAMRAREVVEQEIAIEVAAAYYDVVRQKTLAAAANAALERSGELAAASKAKLAVGRVSRLDVLRAEQLVSHALAQKLESDGATEDAADRLKHLLAIPLVGQIDVSGGIIPLDRPDMSQEVIESAQNVRLEVQAAQTAVAAAERAITAARANLRPHFDIGVALTKQGTGDSLETSLRSDRFRLASFSSFALPLDRTIENVALETAVLERGRVVRDLARVRSSVAQDVRRAIRHEQRAMQSLELARRALDLSREEMDVARLRYDRGLSDNLDVVNADSGLLAAEARSVDALAELAVARLALRRALGIFDPRADVR
jgi:outer membrane protein